MARAPLATKSRRPLDGRRLLRITWLWYYFGMVRKKKRKETGFDKLGRQIEKLATLTKEGFDEVRAELGGQIDGVRKEMHSGFARIDQELASIRAELKSIRADIASLQAAVRQHEGYTKEIDHILQRVVAIERHLGIKHAVSK